MWMRLGDLFYVPHALKTFSITLTSVYLALNRGRGEAMTAPPPLLISSIMHRREKK